MRSTPTDSHLFTARRMRSGFPRASPSAPSPWLSGPTAYRRSCGSRPSDLYDFEGKASRAETSCEAR
jgi:hypothetical protein